MTWLVQATGQATDGMKGLTTRDRSGSESDRRASNRHRQKESGWQTLRRFGEAVTRVIGTDGGLEANSCGR